MDLEILGWNGFFAGHFKAYSRKEMYAGRVFLEHGKNYGIYTTDGETRAEISGKLRFQAAGRKDYPAVGDWVALQRSIGRNHYTIHAILPRQSKFSRKMAGKKTAEQVIAANVDTVFLVSGLDQDFNIRRLERYLLLVWESGAKPVVLLNKADLCQTLELRIAEVKAASPDTPVHPVSGKNHQGIEQLLPYLQRGQTVAMVGSSGTGKSTLVNCLLGAKVQKTQEVRAGDSRGKHTTTRRELIVSPTGGLIMDTPGMRELHLWMGDERRLETFGDIEELAKACRFSNCRHQSESNCAIQNALAEGRLDSNRFSNYVKLQQELELIAAQQNQRPALSRKEKTKKITAAFNRDLSHKYWDDEAD